MRQQLFDVTSGHSHQVWEVETLKAVHWATCLSTTSAEYAVVCCRTRQRLKLVKGVELRQTGNSFEIIVLSGILWFKVGTVRDHAWGLHCGYVHFTTVLKPLCSLSAANFFLCHCPLAQHLCLCGSGGYEFHFLLHMVSLQLLYALPL